METSRKLTTKKRTPTPHTKSKRAQSRAASKARSKHRSASAKGFPTKKALATVTAAIALAYAGYNHQAIAQQLASASTARSRPQECCKECHVGGSVHRNHEQEQHGKCPEGHLSLGRE